MVLHFDLHHLTKLFVRTFNQNFNYSCIGPAIIFSKNQGNIFLPKLTLHFSFNWDDLPKLEKRKITDVLVTNTFLKTRLHSRWTPIRQSSVLRGILKIECQPRKIVRCICTHRKLADDSNVTEPLPPKSQLLEWVPSSVAHNIKMISRNLENWKLSKAKYNFNHIGRSDLPAWLMPRHVAYTSWVYPMKEIFIVAFALRVSSWVHATTGVSFCERV